MFGAFTYYTNLTGTIYIESTEITSINNAFDGTSISEIYIQKHIVMELILKHIIVL